MKKYECDFCNKPMASRPPVKLKGITGTSGGILLPEHFHTKDFCSTDCFWKWCVKYCPKVEDLKVMSPRFQSLDPELEKRVDEVMRRVGLR